MLEYDPVKNLVHYPMPNMKRFGVNPYGEPLYRIVSTATRRKLVGGYWEAAQRSDGTWTPGHNGYHWRLCYPKVAAVFILERWNSPFEFTAQTKAQYERTAPKDPVSGWPINGPYPDRGEYALAWEFDKGVDADNLDLIVGAIERGRQRSYADIYAAHKAEYELEEKQTAADSLDCIRDAFSAYGARPFAGAHAKRGTKTREPFYTAEQIGAPIPRRRPSNPAALSTRKTVDVRDIQVRNTLIAGKRHGAEHQGVTCP